MKSEAVKYAVGGASHQGQLIYDESKTGLPLLLVAPNWRGVVADNIAIGQKHAGDGYVVLMPDMFGEGKGPKGTENPMEFLAPFIEDVAGTRRAIVGALDAMTAEAAKRVAPVHPETDKPTRGYSKLYAEQILGADEGCDFAFLRPQ